MNAYEFIVRMRNYASSGLQDIARQVGVARNQIGGLDSSMRQTEQTSSFLGRSMGRLKNVLATTFAVAAISMFSNHVMEARSEYEKFDVVLANTFQSANVGKAALNMLTDFAEKTPFQLDELTGSFVKLVNRGINPTRSELGNLGDLAASQGKGFDQLTEAMLDAQTGEFERLKEMGITASKNGDKVMFAFKGITKEVGFNKDAITQALLEYGKMPGVAGSMNAIASTMGGATSNLKDKWNSFLVAVGGEASGIFTGVMAAMSTSISFLSGHLSDISQWFNILWGYLSPVVDSIRNFIQAAFGFSDVSGILKTFGNIMNGVLMVVNWLSIGLTSIIDVLTPFADIILYVTAAYYSWNIALGIFNALMLVNPVTWVVLGVMALITVIGMVMKYTSGWGESWTHTVNGAKLIWQTYTDYVSANFNVLVQGLMIGINKIKEGWYSFKDAVGMGNSDENQKMLAQIANDTEARKKSIADGYKNMIESGKAAANEFKQVGITVDTAGIKKDFASLQDKFAGTGQKNTGTGAYDDFVNNGKGKDKAGKNAGAGNGNKDGIVSGGSKITTINISIEKLQDYTNIQVENTEKGISQLGDKVQEMLLRAVNSVNQMQT